MNIADPGSAEILTPEEFESSMYDRRKVHVPIVRRDGKPWPYIPASRRWGATRGITLHQTACNMGERIERYDTIGAHFAVLRSGRILRMCDLNRIVYHGHGWNAQCVGIEIDGLFPGLENDPDTAQDEALRTTWDDPSTPTREQPMRMTPQQGTAARQLVRWIAWETARNGGKIKILCAHRQSSKDRPNDPGQQVWREVALPLHVELGLNDGGPGFRLGDGYEVPEAWDPSRVGVRY